MPYPAAIVRFQVFIQKNHNIICFIKVLNSNVFFSPPDKNIFQDSLAFTKEIKRKHLRVDDDFIIKKSPFSNLFPLQRQRELCVRRNLPFSVFFHSSKTHNTKRNLNNLCSTSKYVITFDFFIGTCSFSCFSTVLQSNKILYNKFLEKYLYDQLQFSVLWPLCFRHQIVFTR